jgi:hypothetical protein
VVAKGPQLHATMDAYLDQMAVSLRPRSIEADRTLRDLAVFMVTQKVRRVRNVTRGQH